MMIDPFNFRQRLAIVAAVCCLFGECVGWILRGAVDWFAGCR